MKIFWSATGTLLAILGGIAITGTYLVDNQPLRLDVAAVNPNLVQLQANTPIKEAQIEQEGVNVETYGESVYLQPEESFVPGQSYNFMLKSITNQFGDTETNLPISFTVPDTLQYFITNSAELGVYNLQKNTETILTAPGFLVNEFAIAGEDVFLLGVSEDKQSEDMWDIPRLQELYKWDAVNLKLTKLLSSEDWNVQKLQASPDGKILSLFKARNESLIIPHLWLYDTTSETWQQYWNESFGAGSNVYVSPDNAWLLAVDLSTNGYSLSPVQEGIEAIPVGNYFNSLGMSNSGRYLLFESYTDDDIFNGEIIFVLFENTGESETIFLDESITPEILSFDPVQEELWFTFADIQGITQLGHYDIARKTTEQITDFTESKMIISLKKPKYNDVLLYGTKEQNIQPNNAEDIQGLLDSYFSEENAPVHKVYQYDLKTNETKSLFDGIILQR